MKNKKKVGSGVEGRGIGTPARQERELEEVPSSKRASAVAALWRDKKKLQ